MARDADIDLLVLGALLLFKSESTSTTTIAALAILGQNHGSHGGEHELPGTLGELLTEQIGPKLVDQLPVEVPLFLRLPEGN